MTGHQSAALIAAFCQNGSMQQEQGGTEHDDPTTGLLVEAFHTELRRLAHRERARVGGSETLRTTALVNEAYLKLYRGGAWRDRAHFLNVAALAMRQVLVSYARERLAAKRGSGAAVLSLEAADDILRESEDRIVALDEALIRLAEREPRLARVVECRYFAGYTEAETALALQITDRTVQRDWAKAKALLYEALEDD
jgi:RNA polymerase sigma factor (TIGR02999 family)